MQIKKITAVLLTLILSISLAACGGGQTPAGSPDVEKQETVTKSSDVEKQQETTQTEDDEDTMIETGQTIQDSADSSNDILILYFSANNTKDVDAISSATPMADGTSSVEWIADIIHENVGGDIVPIIPSVDYPLLYDDLADYAKEEADNDLRPTFEDLGVDPTAYKTVFIGYPIWWYTTPKILETFFETYDFSGVTIIPFNTHAGSHDGGTYSLIGEREPDATVIDGLSVRGEDVGKDDTKNTVIKWLQELDLD